MLGEQAGSNPMVSVVMPVYNGERHLGETLDSLLLQTYTDFEIVAVDDGSTDGSWDLLQRYAARDERVRPHALPLNCGHHVSSTEAIRRARGRYLARQDQDDIALPRRIEASLDAMQGRHAGLVNAAYLRWLPDGSLVARYPPATHTGLRVALTFENVICHSTVMIDRDAVPQEELHYRDVPGPQDYDLWVRLLRHTQGLTLQEPLVVYRQETMAMSNRFEDRMAGAVEGISREQIEDLIGPGSTEAVRRLNGFRPAPGDWRHVRALQRVYEALAKTPGLEGGEVQARYRAWSERALRAAISGSAPALRDPRLIAEVVRRHPNGAARVVHQGVRRAVAARMGR